MGEDSCQDETGMLCTNRIIDDEKEA